MDRQLNIKIYYSVNWLQTHTQTHSHGLMKYTFHIHMIYIYGRLLQFQIENECEKQQYVNYAKWILMAYARRNKRVYDEGSLPWILFFFFFFFDQSDLICILNRIIYKLGCIVVIKIIKNKKILFSWKKKSWIITNGVRERERMKFSCVCVRRMDLEKYSNKFSGQTWQNFIGINVCKLAVFGAKKWTLSINWALLYNS